MPKITTIDLADGTRRYRFTIDTGRDPATGKRRQRRYTFARKAEARAELGRLTGQVADGTHTDRWDGTVNELCDEYLKSATFGKEANTKACYRDALRVPRARLGGRKARSITAADIETHVRDFMLTRGRARGGTPGTPLGARSVRLALQQLSAAFALAVKRKRLVWNPCETVDLPAQSKAARPTWGEAEVRAFLEHAGQDRLAACWRLTAYGLRRGEVAGLRWDAVDLDAATITVGLARVVVDGRVIVKPPKSDRGFRTLPADPALIAALRALRTRQAAERLAAGTAYTPSGYVAVDELGAAVHPEWLTDEFHRIAQRAGLERIRLHDGRHTSNSLMAAAGVPDHIRAAWCGHTAAVNVATYTHARPEDLVQARDALAAIYGTG